MRLHSLYCRRKRGALFETFKILNGLENVEASKFFEMRQPGRTRGHTMKIFKPRVRLLTRQRFFSIRVIDLWNGLPQNMVDAKTVPQVKARLDQHWNSLGYGYQQRPMAKNNPLTCKCKDNAQSANVRVSEDCAPQSSAICRLRRSSNCAQHVYERQT